MPKCTPFVQSCTHCLYGKMHRLPFPNSKFVASSPFELVHFDVWGPAPVMSVDDFRYYVLFVDHFTRFTWLYLLKSKSKVFSKFIEFKAMVETQFSTKIKTLRSDGGGEYTFSAFKSYLLQHDITHQISCPYTPQQNGLFERKHRHLVETTITLLSQASMPTTYWSYAILSTVFLINLLPTSILGFTSPWSKLYSSSPDLSQLKVFGCACYPLLRPYTSHKLDPRTKECLFLGYFPRSKGYLCLDLSTHNLYVSRHVLLNESKFHTITSSSYFTSSSSVSYLSNAFWLSSLFYLHASNQPSLLGPYSSNTTPLLLVIPSTYIASHSTAHPSTDHPSIDSPLPTAPTSTDHPSTDSPLPTASSNDSSPPLPPTLPIVTMAN